MLESWGIIQKQQVSVSKGFIQEWLISSANDAVLIGTRVMYQYEDDVIPL